MNQHRPHPVRRQAAQGHELDDHYLADYGARLGLPAESTWRRCASSASRSGPATTRLAPARQYEIAPIFENSSNVGPTTADVGCGRWRAFARRTGSSAF